MINRNFVNLARATQHDPLHLRAEAAAILQPWPRIGG